MSDTTTYHPPLASFHYLSQDIEGLIFEFLPLSDFPSLQLVSKRFHHTLHHSPRLWARQIFSKFLKPNREFDDILEEDQDGLSPITDDQVLFNEMTSSRTMIQAHYATRLQLHTCLRHALSSEATKSLTEKLVKALEAPDYPCPFLKRDIHHFETKTLFQNFLTEVFFGIQDRGSRDDKKQSPIRMIIEKLRKSYDVDAVTRENSLQLLRGSSTGHQDPEQAGTTEDEQETSSLEERTEVRYAETRDVLEHGSLKPADFIGKFCSFIQGLVQNRCDMIRECLQAITSQQDIISEYCRLWREFTLAIMEVNRALSPLTQFINDLNKKGEASENVPELSAWRAMLDVWRNTVFEPLSQRLLEAFAVTLCLAREESRTPTGGKIFEPVRAVSQQFSEDAEALTEVVDDNLKVLRAFHNAISDLSYDEMTVFYWKCLATIKGTPKAQLDDKIIEEILSHYRKIQTAWIKKPQELILTLKEDQKLVEIAFDRELALRMKESQLEYIRSLLTERLVSICDSLCPPSGSTIEGIEAGRPTQALSMNSFEHLFKTLDAEKLVSDRIGSDEKTTQGFLEALEKERGNLFNSLLTYCDKLKDEITSQYEENQEIYLDLVQRGLGQAKDEEDPSPLFIITRDSFNEHYVAKQWSSIHEGLLLL